VVPFQELKNSRSQGFKNSRIQEAEVIGPANNSMPATPRGKDIIKQDRARLIDTSRLLEFLSS
jgi:hypothetical protein